MKNNILLTILITLFASTAWAADVTVTDCFKTVSQAKSSGETGSNWTGDVCRWNTKFARRGTNDKINSNQATWITLTSTVRGYIKTTNLEGGIKAVSFKYAQFGAEDGIVLKWQVSAGELSNTVERDGDSDPNKDAPATYSHTFNCKTNAQLEILNMSVLDNGNQPSSNARLLVGDVTITPYILYRNKDVTVGLKQRGYVNNGSADFINNTGNEGSIFYSSSATNVATVDGNGVITPVSVGDAIITATWSEGASTTYTLHVVDGIVAENFSKVKQTSQTTGATWAGDLFDWEVANVRRGADDTLGLNPRIQATAFRSNAGSSLVTKEEVEGGVKHVAFDWRQWASGTTPLTIDMYYSTDKENWGDAVATQSEDAVGAATPHSFSEDIDDGAKGNAYLKLNYTSGAGVAVMGAMKITPWLLYTTKEATLDTRVNLTYTNAGLINNTNATPTYEIAPENAAVSINSDGQVAVEDGAEVNADFTVTATWSAVTTTYTLHIISRTNTTASYPKGAVHLALGGTVNNTLDYTEGYNGTISYESSNMAVATVTSEGVVSLAGGVGQTTITATLPQTDDYKAASASYNLYVHDNGSRIEMFSGVTQTGVVGEILTEWNGDLFTWQAQYQVRRGTNDTIHAGITKHQGTSIGIQDPTGTPLSSILQSKGAVEGGIKYLTFYWMQWGAASGGTRRIAVYADNDLIGYQENPSGTSGKAGDEFMLGINNAMKSNKQLIIKNESYKSSVGTLSNASNCSRIVLDNIYITPYLRYTLKVAELDMRDNPSDPSYTNPYLIDNTDGGKIVYSLEDNEDEATINATTGKVTGLKTGQVKVVATWQEEGASAWYTLNIVAATNTEASFENAIVRIGLDESVSNALNITDGYETELASESKSISYTSSNTSVASYSAGVWTVNGVGQTTITASLPATASFTAAEASYNLYVRDKNATIKEHFKKVANGTGSIGEKDTVWTGVAFDWKPQGAIRHNGSDTIWGTATKNRSVWIATTAEAGGNGVLGSKEVIEGGIKYLSFYWQQWGAGANTLRLAAFAGDTRKEYMERPGTDPSTYEKFLFGANNFMKKNEKLYIKNESFSGESFDPANITTANSRMIIDTIFITPWLLFTDKTERIMRIGETDQNTSLINNIGEDATFISSDPTVASVAGDGTVTAIKRGKVTITAKYEWNESESVTTTYPVAVYPVNCETFDGIEQTSNYGNTTPRAGDKATWTTSLGGFNVGDCAALTTNLVRFRAPYQGSSEKAYIQSTAIEGGIASMTFDWNLGGAETATNWDIRVIINGREVKKLTNTDITATNAMDHFEQITINGINEPDNFTIRFENHSTINGAYTSGNKARFLIDNITWTNYTGTKTLSENADNSAWLAANNNETRTVIIDRSPMVANVWNTLCLPFAISKSDDLDGAEVQVLTSASLADDILEIGFSALDGDVLEAGKPYLVKPATNKNISGTYSGKEIHAASYIEKGSVTLQGILSPTVLVKDDYSTLFVGTPDGSGNNLYYPSENGTLKGFRAYFKIADEVAPSAPLRRARFVVNEQQVVTSIDTDRQTANSQKLLRNGQLIIIRDGVHYDVLGRKL